MKKILTTIFILAALFTGSAAFAQNSTIPQVQQWLTSNGYIKAASSTAGVQVPGLGSTGSPCITVGTTGKFGTSTCGGAGNTFQYPLIDTAGTVSLGFGTTTQNTWSLHNIFSSLFATNASSTNATSSNFSITNALSFGGVVGTTWASFCTAITGGSGLCDGTDDAGSGGGTNNWSRTGTEVSLATTSDTVYVGTVSSDAKLTVAATSSLGAELLTNPGFTGSAANWNIGSCFTYSNNVLYGTYDGSCLGVATQTIAVAPGTYRISYTASASTTGSFCYGFDQVDANTTCLDGSFATTTVNVDVEVTAARVDVGFSFADSVGDTLAVDSFSLKALTLYPSVRGYDHNGLVDFFFGDTDLKGNVLTLLGDMLFDHVGNGDETYKIHTEASSTQGTNEVFSDYMSIYTGDASQYTSTGVASPGNMFIGAGNASTTVGAGGDVEVTAGYSEAGHLNRYAFGTTFNLSGGGLRSTEAYDQGWSIIGGDQTFDTYATNVTSRVGCDEAYYTGITDVNGIGDCFFRSGGFDIAGTSTTGAIVELERPSVSGDDIKAGAFTIGSGSISAGLSSTIAGAILACQPSQYSSSTHAVFGGQCDFTAGQASTLGGGGDFNINAGDGDQGGSIAMRAGASIDFNGGNTALYGGDSDNSAAGGVYLYGGQGTVDGSVILGTTGGSQDILTVSGNTDNVNISTQLTVTHTANDTNPAVKFTMDSADAGRNALWVTNNTNWAHAGDLTKLVFRNASDSGALLKLENAGTGNYFTADSVAVLTKAGRLGIGTTSPWGKLSVVNDGTLSSPSFVVATTSGSLYPSLFVTASSSDVAGNDARVMIGRNNQYGLAADQFFLNGRMNIGEWRFVESQMGMNIATAITTDSQSISTSLSNIEDANGSTIGVVSSGSYYTRMSPGATAVNTVAGDGMGQAFSTAFMRLATNTPVMEVSARVGSSGNASSTFYQIGFFNGTGLSPDYASTPTQGCGFLASTTEANWIFVCINGATMSFTNTGNATSSAGATNVDGIFYDFRIEANGTSACGWMRKSRSANWVFVACKTGGSLPLTTSLNPTVAVGKNSAGLSPDLHLRNARVWWYDPQWY